MVLRKDCWSKFMYICLWVLGFLLFNKGVELFYLLGPSWL